MIKVAIIEDIDDYRNAIVSLLGFAEGYECVGAFETAEAALIVMPSIRPDVALVDIGLPNMNGIELVALLKKQTPDTICIICSAYDDDENIFKALAAGALGYILKSSSPTQILNAIQEATQGGSPMSSIIARKVISAMHSPSVIKTNENHLTARELEILDHLSKGLLYKEIAARLFISLDTVKRHCYHIYEKLHVNNRTEALNKYYQK